MNKNRKSFLMIFALFVFVLLTVLVYAMASLARYEVLKAKAFIKRKRAYYLLIKGVNDARGRLLDELTSSNESDDETEAEEAEPVNLSQNWAEVLEEDIEYSHPFAKAKLEVVISDENGYIDLVTFKDDLELLLAKSFGKVAYEQLDDDYIPYIEDYQDEDEDERKLGSEQKSKNAPIVVLDELRLIFDKMDNDQFEQLVDNWSLTPNGAQLNINTVSEDNLVFISDAFEEKYMFAKKAFDEILAFRSHEDSENSNYYDEESFAKLISANPNLKTLFEKCFTINSSRFRIKSTVEIDNKVQSLIAVYDLEKDQFVYWRYK